MKRIGDMLETAVGRPEVLRTARANIVLEQWREVVGEVIASKSQPKRYDKGVVTVIVTGSAWAQEIRLLQDTIVARLNEKAGEPLFTSLRATISTTRPGIDSF